MTARPKRKPRKMTKRNLPIPPSSTEIHKHFDFETNANWEVLRIMSEFVDGFDFLAPLEKEVTFFGSNRVPPTSKYYKLAEKLAFKLGKNGYTIITGGGLGIMEAANKGASRAKADSVSLHLQIAGKKDQNQYYNKNLDFRHYFTQKVMMAASSQAYIFFPGGFGTLDNLSGLVTLIQTKKMEPIPIILIGKGYWEPFLEYIESTFKNEYATISPSDVKIYKFVGDDLDKAYNIVKKTKARHYF